MLNDCQYCQGAKVRKDGFGGYIDCVCQSPSWRERQIAAGCICFYDNGDFTHYPGCPVHPPPKEKVGYHDLHITTKNIDRTSIFNLPFDLTITCTRAGGWELWCGKLSEAVLLAGEYADPENWLVLDVAGHVILDSRGRE